MHGGQRTGVVWSFPLSTCTHEVPVRLRQECQRIAPSLLPYSGIDHRSAMVAGSFVWMVPPPLRRRATHARLRPAVACQQPRPDALLRRTEPPPGPGPTPYRTVRAGLCPPFADLRNHRKCFPGSEHRQAMQKWPAGQRTRGSRRSNPKILAAGHGVPCAIWSRTNGMPP